MEQSNSHKLRLSLASAIRHHIQEAGMTGKQAAAYSGVAGSRISAIMLGKVRGISCDALVDILGNLGYQFTSVVGSNDGHEFYMRNPESGKSVIPAEIAQPQPIGAPHE